ncbi:MAG: LytR family transcriptional regulator [Propionibacteriales bacterium]|nr:LytR family transcriptional regulator [Propionibacteriales bacterium]
MRRDAAGRVTSTVVAVVSVLALGAALAGFLFDSPSDDKAVAAKRPAAVATTADPAPTPTPSPATKPKPKATPTRDDAVPQVYVEVYNMSGVSGLASSKAAELQDAGWQVVGIDNWRGNIPASTVYYPDDMADAAEQLAKTLGIGRTRGAVAPMKFDRLTVILTTDAT